MRKLMELNKHIVEKPWGRTDIPAAFGDFGSVRVGEIWYETDDGLALPLLVKWLFTSEKLSIQVHPSDAEAHARRLPSGKEECWYIVDAEPGAVLGIGTIRPLNSDELRAASLSGEIEQLMDWKPVKAGDYFYIPAGTVHAIGAGITLVEVQQYADITYRLFDYGRPRELHLDDGVNVSKAAPYADPRSGQAAGNMQLVDGPHFRLWLVSDAIGLAAIPDGITRWVIPLSGAGVGRCRLMAAGEPLSLAGPMLVAA
jgi:mannose-6-phosphate isomerase